MIINVKKEIVIKISGLGTLAIIAIFMLFGYFVYGGFNGAFAMLLYTILLSVGLLIAFIPLGGFVLYILLFLKYINPWVYDLTGIHATLLTNILFALYIILASIISFATLITFLDIIKD